MSRNSKALREPHIRLRDPVTVPAHGHSRRHERGTQASDAWPSTKAKSTPTLLFKKRQFQECSERRKKLPGLGNGALKTRADRVDLRSATAPELEPTHGNHLSLHQLQNSPWCVHPGTPAPPQDPAAVGLVHPAQEQASSSPSARAPKSVLMACPGHTSCYS